MAVKSKTSKARAIPIRVAQHFKGIDNTFQTLSKPAQEAPAPMAHRYEAALRSVQRQRKFYRDQLDSDEALDKYIENHPQRQAVTRRLEKLVKGKTAELRKVRALTKESMTGQFRALAMAHYVQPSAVFPEFEDEPNVCGLQKLAAWYKSNGARLPADQAAEIAQAIAEALEARVTFLRNRYQAITGQEFTALPTLDTVTRFKASAPVKVAWSDELYSMEAERTNHPAALNADASASTSSSTPTATSTRPTPSTSTSTAQTPLGMCDMAHIVALAGGRPLEQPDATGDPLYTFPQKLALHENVFYDYSVIIPVDECGPCGPQTVLTPRTLLAAKVLCGKANTIVEFLDSVGLATALGRYGSQNVVQDLRTLLEEVLAVNVAASTADMRNLKRKLRDMAGLMRLVGRTEAFLGDFATDDPRRHLETLRDAIQRFPRYRLKNTRLPTTNEDNDVWANTLEFPDDNATYYGDNNVNGHNNVPNAQRYDHFELDDVQDESGGWQWAQHDEQRHDLRNYVRFLADSFQPRLQRLMDEAQAMAGAVDSFSGSYGGFETDFQRLAAGVINDAALGLGLILDAIAAQLTLPVNTRQEGSKRLALQLVFRQFWHPEGYVMGKLVGYKNLIPNQKETLKRRTFVKTSREVSSVEEFANERQDDRTLTQKESAEITKEMSQQFNFTQSASGHYEVQVWGVSGQTDFGFNMAETSKAVQTMSAEAVSKSSAKYTEKREVKIRELTEAEEAQEVTTELANLNQEITANYFYYQLLRQYRVTISLHDLRPVLLRAREVPNPAEVDDKWISTYGYALFRYLPPQLAGDAQECADRLDSVARRLIRARTEMFQRTAEFEVLRNQPTPSGADAAALNRYQEEYRSKERLLSEARDTFVEAETEYSRLQARMHRVTTHVRNNICHYMQYVWQASPTVDQDMLLQDETFCGQPLPQVTRGLIRQGYFGNEEIFDYTGRSIALFDMLLSTLQPGSELASMPIEELQDTSLFQYLRRYFPAQTDALVSYIRENAFVDDPVDPERVLSTRSVQIAQDALVVETMPGQVPLLEGFQMAHRMLNVQRACLENIHLNERIADRPWQKTGDDTYVVRRYDGAVPPQREVKETP